MLEWGLRAVPQVLGQYQCFLFAGRSYQGLEPEGGRSRIMIGLSLFSGVEVKP